jgi:hypothetical protein
VIVRLLDTGRLLLITQPDHAHMARTAIEQCAALIGHPRRASLLTAVGEHDNGWTEEDAAPTVDQDTGAVVDFITAPRLVRQRVWPRGVARLAHDPWAAALVAQHAITVYERFRSDPEWTPFFAGMEAERDGRLQASGQPRTALASDYPFVRLGDLISLTFCTGWTDPQTFAPWTVRRSGDRILVTPDPFGGATIPIAIAALEIYGGPFASNDELRRALDDGTSITLRGEVAGE